MQQPEGFRLRGQESKVLHLHPAIYGLKQAALAWWKELESSMNRIGFKRTVSDAGVFFTYIGKNLILIIVYVDDAIFFGKNKKAILQAKKAFMDMWECQDLSEAQEFLRMKIWRHDGKIYLDQTAYQCTPEFRQTYQSTIGSLLYIMLGTRPDITYAVTKLAQFSVNPLSRRRLF